jgi:hypothetical protein
MNRDEQEMALWREVYHHGYSVTCWTSPQAAEAAAYAVEYFRKQYPPAPPLAQRPATWYDEPPFSDDVREQYAWVEGFDLPCHMIRRKDGWTFRVVHGAHWRDLDGRKVCPLFKPPESTP